MTTDNKAANKSVKKPVSLTKHKFSRAKDISNYIFDCISLGEKIDKAFLKELGEIA